MLPRGLCAGPCDWHVVLPEASGQSSGARTAAHAPDLCVSVRVFRMLARPDVAVQSGRGQKPGCTPLLELRKPSVARDGSGGGVKRPDPFRRAACPVCGVVRPERGLARISHDRSKAHLAAVEKAKA